MGYYGLHWVYLRSVSAVRERVEHAVTAIEYLVEQHDVRLGILPEVCTIGSLRCSKATAFRYVSSLSAALPAW